MDQSKIQASFEKHESNPEVSVEEYVRAHRIKLGEAVAKRQLVYLDTCYWIILRDVILGRREDPSGVRLLDSLRSRVRSEAAICPVSEAVFAEVLKQQDLQTRRQTAELIDELSLGVTLAPQQERVGTEFAHFLQSSGKESLHPLKWLVWSKMSFILGIMHPSNPLFDPTQESVIQKSFFDFLWDCPLAEIVEILGNKQPPPLDFEALASRLNASNEAHAGEIRSFQQAYSNEIGGCLDLHMPVARQILENMFEKETGIAATSSEVEANQREAQLRNAFLAVFLYAEHAGRRLPTLHIHALCHASVRWDKKRKLKGNDLLDFHHAAAALPYCDVLLTENPLRALLEARHLNVAEDFSCRILSDPDDWLSG